LTALAVSRAKRRGYYDDGGGLWPQVGASGYRGNACAYPPVPCRALGTEGNELRVLYGGSVKPRCPKLAAR